MEYIIKEFISKKGNYIILLEDFYGAGWLNNVIEAIKTLNVSYLDINEIEVSWNFSEYEITLEKNNLKFKIEIDDLGPIGFILISNPTEENKNKLKDWALVIAKNIEQQKHQ